MDHEIRKDDVGTQFTLTVYDENGVCNISSATTKTFIFLPPGTPAGAARPAVTKTASFVTDGTDGKLKYVSNTGDIGYTGMWKLQAQVVTPSASRKSTIVLFEVFPNLV